MTVNSPIPAAAPSQPAATPVLTQPAPSQPAATPVLTQPAAPQPAAPQPASAQPATGKTAASGDMSDEDFVNTFMGG